MMTCPTAIPHALPGNLFCCRQQHSMSLQICTVSKLQPCPACKNRCCSTHALSQPAAVCRASAALGASACPRKAAHVQVCPTNPVRARQTPPAVCAHPPWRTCTADQYDLRAQGSRVRPRRVTHHHSQTAPVAYSKPTGPKWARPAVASGPTDPSTC